MDAFGAPPFVVIDGFGGGMLRLLSTMVVVVLVPLVPAAMAAAVAKASAIVEACSPAVPFGDCSDI